MPSSCFHQNERVLVPTLSSQKKQDIEFKQNQMQMYRLNHDEDVGLFFFFHQRAKQIITTKLNVMQQVYPISSRKKKIWFIWWICIFHLGHAILAKLLAFTVCIILRFYDSFVTREKGTYLPRQWTCCFLIKLWQKKNVWLFRRSDRVQALILFVRLINDETVKKFNRYSQA